MSITQRQFRYKNIFMYGSLQSVGHTEEYFAAHTQKLVVYIIMPRVQGKNNLLRIYRRGSLLREMPVWSTSNFFFYYASWFFHYWKFLLTYFARDEAFFVFSGHPISFFGMSIQKILRPRVSYAFWVGDYYPPVHWSLRIYEWVKKFYHDRIGITYYLSDTINEMMNGKVVNRDDKRTVMWGVSAHSQKSKVKSVKEKPFRLLFIGVVRPSQGLEELFSFLADHPDVHLRIVGVSERVLYEAYKQSIRSMGIDSQVAFPNAFVDDAALKRMAKDYHVGIALYEKGPTTATHYTDPGKVKTYAELGLPVVMTSTSAIAPYIRRFKAGEVIDDLTELLHSLASIRRNYAAYQKGLLAFAAHFEYERYYQKAFTALEKAR